MWMRSWLKEDPDSEASWSRAASLQTSCASFERQRTASLICVYLVHYALGDTSGKQTGFWVQGGAGRTVT